MHKFHPSVLREYDIRGIVEETLWEDDASAIGRAFGTIVQRNGGRSVAVGYDGRLSSPTMKRALIDGLTSTGMHVFEVGLGPTPMLYFSVYELETDGGIMVTGSHNPPNYNGFKMMLGHNSFYGRDIQKLGALAGAGDFAVGAGSHEVVPLRDAYVDRLLADIVCPTISAVWDAGNGSAGQVVEEVTARLPGTHRLINTTIDGTFPAHHPDPTVEANLAELKAEVAEHSADIGLAFDGDGDRIGAIDGNGRVVWGDQLLALLAAPVLEELPGAPIIADVKASRTLFDRIAELGGKPVMWKTGHSLIKSRMAELQAPLAGEMSGHIFFQHRYYGFDDAIYAALRLLEAIGNSGMSLAELCDQLPVAVNTPELRFPCDEAQKFAAVERVRTLVEASGREFSAIDGVRVNQHGGWWLLRASNTQAVLVARCEAPDEERLEALKKALVEALETAGIDVPDNIFG